MSKSVKSFDYVVGDEFIKLYEAIVEGWLIKVNDDDLRYCSSESEARDSKRRKAFGDEVGNKLRLCLYFSLIYFSKRGLMDEKRQLVWEKGVGFAESYKDFFEYCLFNFLDKEFFSGSSKEVESLFLLFEKDFPVLAGDGQCYPDVDLSVEGDKILAVCPESFLEKFKEELNLLFRQLRRNSDEDEDDLFFCISDELACLLEEIYSRGSRTPAGVEEWIKSLRLGDVFRGDDDGYEIKTEISEELRGGLICFSRRFFYCSDENKRLIWRKNCGFIDSGDLLSSFLLDKYPSEIGKRFVSELNDEFFKWASRGVETRWFRLEVKDDAVYMDINRDYLEQERDRSKKEFPRASEISDLDWIKFN
ncbi:hypothetical protein ACFL2R_01900 [Patescibacteria group bacterium]